MGRMSFDLPKELDDKFRIAIAERYGMRKGNLSKAIEAAIELWIKGGKK